MSFLSINKYFYCFYTLQLRIVFLCPQLRARLQKPPASTSHKPLARASHIAFCTLLQQWIRAADSRRGVGPLALPCPSPGMFSARP